MSDGLIHKDGKRFEPFTNKEVEETYVKVHTKHEHKKKQEPQSIVQTKSKKEMWDDDFEEKEKIEEHHKKLKDEADKVKH